MRVTTCCLIATLSFVTSGCDGLTGRFFDRAPEFEPPAPLPARATVPIAVAIEGDTVLVGMDDLQQCRGNAGAAATSGNGWTGTLAECAYPYTYEVVLAAGTPPGFVQLDPVETTGLPSAEGEVPFRPIAVVTITDLQGRGYRFESVDGF